MSIKELDDFLTKKGWHRQVQICYDPKCDRQYEEHWRKERKKYNGRVGTLVDLHNSHGLCLEVKFDNGNVVCYDIQELKQVSGSLP